MGVSTTISVACDYSGCKVGKTGPFVIQWNKEAVESGRIPMPDEAKYLVLFNQNGVPKSFCCQLHAAEYFLPPGYEAKQKQVVEFPAKGDVMNVSQETPAQNWMDIPQRSENPDNGQGDRSNED